MPKTREEKCAKGCPGRESLRMYYKVTLGGKLRVRPYGWRCRKCELLKIDADVPRKFKTTLPTMQSRKSSSTAEKKIPFRLPARGIPEEDLVQGEVDDIISRQQRDAGRPSSKKN